MKEIKFKNEIFFLPQSWEEITVNQLVEIEKLNETEEVSLERMNRIAGILMGCEPERLKQFPIDEYLALIAAISDVLGSSPNNSKFLECLTFEGKKYVAKEVSEWNTREFTDFDTLSQEKANFPLLLALIYREEGEELTSENYAEKIKERAETLKNLPASVGISAISFFSKSLLNFINDMVLSSETASRQLKKNPKMMEEMNRLKGLIAGAGL